jgi:hypothetical protein
MKGRAVGCAEKSVPYVQRVIQSNSAFVRSPKNRQKHCDFNGAGRMKPPIPLQRKLQTAPEIMERYSNRSSFALGGHSTQLLS